MSEVEKKKLDVLLVGPHAAGKTTIFKVLKGEKIPAEYYTTQGRDTEKISPHIRGMIGRWFHKDKKFLDTGGGEFDRIENWVKSNDAEHFIIVFDGVKFLREMDEPEIGGPTSSYCKMLLSILKDKGGKINFVATHQDSYESLYGGGSMKDEIIRKIQKINRDYSSLFASKRYPIDMEGRLFGVKAKDKESVAKVFKEILE